MDWTVYGFMLSVCIAIAGVAMFCGISGAARLIPVFLIGFPLCDVPKRRCGPGEISGRRGVRRR